jgi:hypothetical protein
VYLYGYLTVQGTEILETAQYTSDPVIFPTKLKNLQLDRLGMSIFRRDSDLIQIEHPQDQNFSGSPARRWTLE